ncbi:MAG: hypothetical protein PHI12_13630 [Dehalococcoidales bacterium]|nr:hypothetical protein [Dehalococcoidales bacterium]
MSWIDISKLPPAVAVVYGALKPERFDSTGQTTADVQRFTGQNIDIIRTCLEDLNSGGLALKRVYNGVSYWRKRNMSDKDKTPVIKKGDGVSGYKMVACPDCGTKCYQLKKHKRYCKGKAGEEKETAASLLDCVVNDRPGVGEALHEDEAPEEEKEEPEEEAPEIKRMPPQFFLPSVVNELDNPEVAEAVAKSICEIAGAPEDGQEQFSSAKVFSDVRKAIEDGIVKQGVPREELYARTEKIDFFERLEELADDADDAGYSILLTYERCGDDEAMSLTLRKGKDKLVNEEEDD